MFAKISIVLLVVKLQPDLVRNNERVAQALGQTLDPGRGVYGVADSGIATCWDAKTGTVHWQERIEGNYSASPIVAEGKIFFLSEDGVGTVVKAARTFEKIATNTLEERALASYAVADGALFIRTAGHLYRMGRQ